MDRGLTRRQFLKVTAAGGALLVSGVSLEACGDGEPAGPVFFNAHQRDTLSAAVARIVPADETPGAVEAGVVDYVEQLLTALEHTPPRIFAGGPFSDRNPYPDNTRGVASNDFSANEFERFLPLTRTQRLAWVVRLYGSQAIEGGDFNDAVLGPTPGYRATYSAGLAELDTVSQQRFGHDFVALDGDQQDDAMSRVDKDFSALVLAHTLEGMYAAPEYGGNKDLAGWRPNKFEGDSQPLGYSIWDESAGKYRERPDHPMSTANPDEDYHDFSDAAIEVVSAIVGGTGGKRFF